MSLKAVYDRFLADPASAALAQDVQLIYITTTTTVTGADAVRKHLATQKKIAEPKSHRVLSAVEASDAVVLDVEWTIEFITGGGAYLPALDENFLVGRTVKFPSVRDSVLLLLAKVPRAAVLMCIPFCRCTSSALIRRTRSDRSRSTGTKGRCSSKPRSLACVGAPGPSGTQVISPRRLSMRPARWRPLRTAAHPQSPNRRSSPLAQLRPACDSLGTDMGR